MRYLNRPYQLIDMISNILCLIYFTIVMDNVYKFNITIAWLSYIHVENINEINKCIKVERNGLDLKYLW